MRIVVVQSRLDSSRLPEKALLPLGNKPILAWVLDTMKMVSADRYFLATDEASAPRLFPIALSCGWECFKGPKEDVLERFCLLAEQTQADEIIRATGDNPFLFYDAARSLSEEYDKHDCDYITFVGLPHGSGVEMFNAKSLLQARKLTDNSYDHEHVGPSLYGHPENFLSLMIPSPVQWNHPNYRTTVDTYADYRRALRMMRFLPSFKGKKTFTSEEICKAFENTQVLKPILLVPSVKKGHGTGHLRRCLMVAKEIGCDIYIPQNDETLTQTQDLINEFLEEGLESWQICKELPKSKEYSLIVTDLFSMSKQEAETFSTLAPMASIDEGSTFTTYCDFLLDIIPSVGMNRKPNLENHAFIPLPETRKTKEIKEITKILVSIGGEDPENLTYRTSVACGKNEYSVTAISDKVEALEEKLPEDLKRFVKYIKPVKNLTEKLHSYDLVITHYGFTAFEASAAGCAVILLETSPLHAQLSRKYGFTVLPVDAITPEQIKKTAEKPSSLFPSEKVLSIIENERRTLSDFVLELDNGERMNCPVCNTTNRDVVVCRTPERTFRKCSSCGMVYMSWKCSENKKYDEAYFFDDYKKQYGKTYLEDFATIKTQCTRRTSIIDSLFWNVSSTSMKFKKNKHIPTVLDVGCAYGPFLEAASDAGWQSFGIDVSKDAIEYVQTKLHFPAVCESFPNFDPVNEFGVKIFDAITMWYVIEHFRNLDIVLKTVAKFLKKGGVFAFSTPSGNGISARARPDEFYKASPADHYSIWTAKNANSILAKYGFRIEKVVSTGHHPERFPCLQNKKNEPNSLKYRMINHISRLRHLGDTFEVYCKKIR